MRYTEEAVDHLAQRIGQVQDFLGRRILVRTFPAICVTPRSAQRVGVCGAVCERAGCGLLLDVNNVYVNACNHGFAAADFLAGVPAALVGEIHLAGYEQDGLGADRHAWDGHR